MRSSSDPGSPVTAPANHAKLDAALALALHEAGESDTGLDVFVELGEDAGDVEEHLARLGVPGGDPGARVLSATLSARQVSELSQQPWVRRVRLSQGLKLSPTVRPGRPRPRPPTPPGGRRGAG